MRTHLVATGTMSHKPLHLRRHITALVPDRTTIAGPCTFLTPLPVPPQYTSRGGMPPRKPRCQFG